MQNRTLSFRYGIWIKRNLGNPFLSFAKIAFLEFHFAFLVIPLIDALLVPDIVLQLPGQQPHRIGVWPNLFLYVFWRFFLKWISLFRIKLPALLHALRQIKRLGYYLVWSTPTFELRLLLRCYSLLESLFSYAQVLLTFVFVCFFTFAVDAPNIFFLAVIRWLFSWNMTHVNLFPLIIMLVTSSNDAFLSGTVDNLAYILVLEQFRIICADRSSYSRHGVILCIIFVHLWRLKLLLISWLNFKMMLKIWILQTGLLLTEFNF